MLLRISIIHYLKQFLYDYLQHLLLTRHKVACRSRRVFVRPASRREEEG